MRTPYRTLFWLSLAMTVLTWAVHVERIQAHAYTSPLLPTAMTLLGILGLITTLVMAIEAKLAT